MRVKIYQPTKNAMQSGKAKSRRWLLEFENENTRFTEPLMGWTGNADTQSQLRLSFASQAEAVEYAARQGYDYQVIPPHQPKLHLRSYASNFTA